GWAPQADRPHRPDWRLRKQALPCRPPRSLLHWRFPAAGLHPSLLPALPQRRTAHGSSSALPLKRGERSALRPPKPQCQKPSARRNSFAALVIHAHIKSTRVGTGRLVRRHMQHATYRQELTATGLDIGTGGGRLERIDRHVVGT